MEYLNDNKINGQSSGDVLRGIFSTISTMMLMWCYVYTSILIFKFEPLTDYYILDIIPRILLIFISYHVIVIKVGEKINKNLRKILWGNTDFK